MTVIFKTEDAIFQFEYKAVVQCLEHRKSICDVQELNNLIDVISNQPDQINLSSAQNPYFEFIALELINSSEGSGICKTCGKKYNFNQLEAFIVGPDDATFRVASTGKVGFKSLFRKRLKLPNLYGGEGFRCPEGHILIFLRTWTT